MSTPSHAIARHSGSLIVPAIVADAGDQAARRFVELFTATIRNANTRQA
ncbi:hypothetical protein [Singulisphaera sp. GP187]|nr:hypothetical protein [Singulisphaera sp. GP187]